MDGFSSRGVYLVLDEVQLRLAAKCKGQVIQQYLGDASGLHEYLHELRDIGLYSGGFADEFDGESGFASLVRQHAYQVQGRRVFRRLLQNLS